MNVFNDIKTWANASAQTPELGLYLAIYKFDCDNYVVELIEFDSYDGVLGWYEVATDDDGDSVTTPRNVVRYVPHNLDCASLQSVRKYLKEAKQ